MKDKEKKRLTKIGAKVLKSMGNPALRVYIVVIRQNLDDSICGAYATLEQAQKRMRYAKRYPGKVLAKNPMQTSDKSGLIAVAIFLATGDTVSLYEQVDFV